MAVEEKATYLIKSQQLRPQESVSCIVRFHIRQAVESNSCDIFSADERDLAIATGRIDFPFVLDSVVISFGEVLYFLTVRALSMHYKAIPDEHPTNTYP